MKRIILSLTLVFALILVIIITAFNSIQNQEIANKINELAKLNNIVIQLQPQDVELHKFPLPFVAINNLIIPDIGEFTKIEGRLSLWSVLKFNPDLKDLNINFAKIYFKNYTVNLQNHEKLLAKILQLQALDFSVNIDELTFVDLNNKLKLKINNLSSSKNELSGEVSDSDFKINFISQVPDLVTKIVISNDIYKANITTNYVSGIFSNGEINIETLEKKSDQRLKATANLISETNLIKISNINVTSEALVLNGTAELDKRHSSLNTVNVNITKGILARCQEWFDKIEKWQDRNHLDLWTLISSEAKISIAANDINIAAEVFNDINLNMSGIDDYLHIDEFSGLIGDQGKFSFNGNIKPQTFHRLFMGKIQLAHNDMNRLLTNIGFSQATEDSLLPFTLTADVEASSYSYNLQNIDLKSEKLKLSGHVANRYIVDKSHIDAVIVIDELDLDNYQYPFITPALNFLADLAQDMNKDTYLTKFIPVREINNTSSYNIQISNLKYDDHLFSDVSLQYSNAPAKINIDKLLINDNNNFLLANFHLSTENVKPNLNIEIEDGQWQVDFLMPQKLLDFKNTLNTKYNLGKLQINAVCNKFNLEQNGLTLNNIKGKLTNKDQLLNIDRIYADIFGGNLEFSGSLLIEPFTVNLVYALNSAQMNMVANSLPQSFVNPSGIISLGGNISTDGDDLETMLYHLYTKSNLISKGLEIENFGIDDFVTRLNKQEFSNENIKDELDKAMNNGMTSLNNLKANIELNEGILTLNDVSFDNNNISGSGAGSINIYDFTMNINNAISFYQKMQISNSTYSDKRLLKLPINISGTYFEPQRKYDYENIVKDISIIVPQNKKQF